MVLYDYIYLASVSPMALALEVSKLKLDTNTLEMFRIYGNPSLLKSFRFKAGQKLCLLPRECSFILLCSNAFVRLKTYSSHKLSTPIEAQA